ncbi:MAG: hypothetical protein M1831_001974 [Alyxoria varia]|nr:MAG: hypothetical protein M1831_001974 [Alyxoria varia]
MSSQDERVFLAPRNFMAINLQDLGNRVVNSRALRSGVGQNVGSTRRKIEQPLVLGFSGDPQALAKIRRLMPSVGTLIEQVEGESAGITAEIQRICGDLCSGKLEDVRQAGDQQIREEHKCRIAAEKKLNQAQGTLEKERAEQQIERAKNHKDAVAYELTIAKMQKELASHSPGNRTFYVPYTDLCRQLDKVSDERDKAERKIDRLEKRINVLESAAHARTGSENHNVPVDMSRSDAKRKREASTRSQGHAKDTRGQQTSSFESEEHQAKVAYPEIDNRYLRDFRESQTPCASFPYGLCHHQNDQSRCRFSHKELDYAASLLLCLKYHPGTELISVPVIVEVTKHRKLCYEGLLTGNGCHVGKNSNDRKVHLHSKTHSASDVNCLVQHFFRSERNAHGLNALKAILLRSPTDSKKSVVGDTQ